MKKIAVALIVLLLVATTGIPAMAIDLNESASAISKEQAVAYMEIDETTSRAEVEQILAARNDIIFSTSWVADGMKCYILNKDGEIEKVIPNFSDIFPADWELPDLEDQEEALNKLSPWQPEASMPLSGAMQPFYNNSVWLSKPSGQYNTSPFCSFSTTNYVGGTYRGHLETVSTIGYNANTDATYNVGYSNVDTGKSLGFVERIPECLPCGCEPPSRITLGVRASTYTDPGLWTMKVDGEYVY